MSADRHAPSPNGRPRQPRALPFTTVTRANWRLAFEAGAFALAIIAAGTIGGELVLAVMSHLH